MFSRATLTSRPVLTSAAALTVGAAAYYVTRPAPIRFDTATKSESAHCFRSRYKMATKKTFAGPWNSVELKVANVEQVNHDTKRLTFDLPSKEEVSGVYPSAAVLTSHTPEGKWVPVFRPYTPISDPDQPGTLQLLVKHYPNGKASTYMHSLQPGSSLWVRGPLPGYTYKPSSTQRNVLLIAGGAGITPIYSLTQGILRDPNDQTNIQLVWGVNGTRDIILKQELEDLEKRYPDRLKVTYAVSGPESKPEAPSLGDPSKFRKGYVNKALLEEVVQQFKPNTWGDEKGTKVFLCGPPAMEDAIAGKKTFFSFNTGILGEIGVDKTKVHRF